MKKISIIIQREYLTRVRKKSFLVTTFLVPILMVLLIGSMAYLATKGEDQQKIAVIDESGIFRNQLDTSLTNYQFRYVTLQKDESHRELLEREQCDIVLHVYPLTLGKPDSIHLFKEGGVSLSAKEFIDDQLSEIYRVRQFKEAGIDQAKIDSINTSQLVLKSFDLKNNQETSSEIATAIGYVMGFLIYMVIFIYGMGVMRGVSEEKTNRIAEVMISSVKPFQLMMGKIVGIALVGLTQFILWLIFTGMMQFLIPVFLPGFADAIPSGADAQQALQQVPQNELASFLQTLYQQNWTLIIGCFLFYFLGGYFLYAALFAAVGSVVNEDQQEAQQMTIPITMPIVFGFIIMASTIKDPNSTLSVFGSLFPLTSPIVMMARIPYGIPGWQIALSMALLVIGFLGITWIAARIYRTGILMYGKKASWKEVWKWLRYS
jgi:ABC-2 type transport system permease protein